MGNVSLGKCGQIRYDEGEENKKIKFATRLYVKKSSRRNCVLLAMKDMDICGKYFLNFG